MLQQFGREQRRADPAEIAADGSRRRFGILAGIGLERAALLDLVHDLLARARRPVRSCRAQRAGEISLIRYSSLALGGLEAVDDGLDLVVGHVDEGLNLAAQQRGSRPARPRSGA